MKKNSTGFTLVEILVVIAILSGLVAILFPNFMAIRQRARDAQRKSDLKQIQKALEAYKGDRFPPAYPISLPPIGQSFISGTNTYMAKIPGDPSGPCTGVQNGNNNYYYVIGVSGLDYTLAACLENSADPDAVACPVNPAAFSSKTGCDCGLGNTGKCYILTNP